MTRWIGAGLALMLLLARNAACDASDTKMERWALKLTQPAIEVTALQLYKEFSRDDETACRAVWRTQGSRNRTGT